MSACLDALIELPLAVIRQPGRALGAAIRGGAWVASRARARGKLVALAAVSGIVGVGLSIWPPFASVGPGELAVRSNRLTGAVATFGEGRYLDVAGLFEVRRFTVRDQVYLLARRSHASGNAFRSVEGLPVGADLSIRYALDPARLGALPHNVPTDVARRLIRPAVQAAVRTVLGRYTAREILSTKRAEIRQAIEGELRPTLYAGGVLLRNVELVKVEVSRDDRNAMDSVQALFAPPPASGGFSGSISRGDK